ncbi:class I SAM-dependent methyltransferase [Agrobacterium sp. ES01]|uniref:class I SAM-dependent methyltransferase n=1 Tax=Agrobacterium sp. ES01 TaxID=3420714 RepID=UPI003D0C5C55
MTTALATRIKSMIRTGGPISVTDYFSLCLADPENGYYKTRNPFGIEGDFITAPEVSQLFGEMIGVFIIHAWQTHDSPEAVRLVEIGPGRGTMMSDILRVIARLAPSLYDSMSAHLVETSERLQAIQKQTLAPYSAKTDWHVAFDEVPEGFTLIVANELFDAIPIRQWVKTPRGFRERMVGLDPDDNLVFVAGVATIDPELLPDDSDGMPEGTIFETSPARIAVLDVICQRLLTEGGTALIVDYGHMVTGFGDTLQAVLAHQFDPPLAHPGMADLTSHVDFEQLALAARALGVAITGCMFQGDFLRGLGIEQRAMTLSKDKPPEVQADVRVALDRLISGGEGRMGELFKVLAISSPPRRLAPFKAMD